MFFGGAGGAGGNAFASQNANQQAQKRMAIAQMEQELAMTDFLFQKIVDECQSKCVSEKCHNESDLTKGEAVCTDRCVNKFFMTMEKMSSFLTKHAEKMMQESNAADPNVGNGGVVTNSLGSMTGLALPPSST